MGQKDGVEFRARYANFNKALTAGFAGIDQRDR